MGSASFPSLVFSSEPEREEWNFYNVVDKTNRVKRLQGLDSMGTGGTDLLMSTPEDGGWVLLKDRDSEELFLFNLASSQRIPVPPLDDESYEFTFSMPYLPSHPNSSLVAVHTSKPYWLQCRPGADGSHAFIKHAFHDDEFYPSNATTSYQGKVYVRGSCLQVIDPVSASAEHYQVIYPAHVLGSYSMFHMLVAADEELYMVNWNTYCNSEVLQSVDVVKLDLPNRAWVRVDGIGDQVFFMGSSCSLASSVSSTSIKGNRIYFIDITDEQRLCCYDLDYGRLITSRPCPDNSCVCVPPCWVVLDVDVEQLDVILDDHHGSSTSGSEGLDLILKENLVLNGSNLMGADPNKTPPCLLFTYKNDGVYNLVDPFTKKSCRLHLPRLSGSVLYSSRDGWLVVHKTKEVLFLFNISTQEEIQLPPVEKTSSFLYGLALSAPPTSSDCMLFGITRSVKDGTTDILFCRLGDSEWTSLSFPNEDQGPFSPAHNSAVFHNGLFYCLGMDGALGVHDHNKQTWSVLNTYLKDQLAFEVNQCYLLEWEDKLLSVFMDEYDYPREVFHLRDGIEGWVKVTDFGDGLLFLGRYASILTSAPNEDVKNSICLPKFTEEEDDYEPVIIDPWDHDPDELCLYESTEYTLNPCWVMVPRVFQGLANQFGP